MVTHKKTGRRGDLREWWKTETDEKGIGKEFETELNREKSERKLQSERETEGKAEDKLKVIYQGREKDKKREMKRIFRWKELKG